MSKSCLSPHSTLAAISFAMSSFQTSFETRRGLLILFLLIVLTYLLYLFLNSRFDPCNDSCPNCPSTYVLESNGKCHPPPPNGCPVLPLSPPPQQICYDLSSYQPTNCTYESPFGDEEGVTFFYMGVYYIGGDSALPICEISSDCHNIYYQKSCPPR